MKNKSFIFIAILAIAAAFIFATAKDKREERILSEKTKGATNEFSDFEEKTLTLGAVEVVVKPVQLETGKEVIFEVTLDTHSVELSYDLTKIAALKDNKGNVYKALFWEGALGGHHLSGKLSFEPLKEGVSSITLEVANIDNASGEFVWKI